MTAGHPLDRPKGRLDKHSSDTPVSISRRRTSRRRRQRIIYRTLRRSRPEPNTTVWPCAQDDFHDGAGRIASWLLTAIAKIVTHYSQPGQQVLLLSPPHRSSTTVRTPLRRHRYSGLLEAGWTVVRLGRGIQTLTADLAHDDAPSESQSGPGPHSIRSVDQPTRILRPDRDPAGPSSDRFDLIVTAAEPSAFDRSYPTDWAHLLTQNGTFAVITHSDDVSGRLVDPAGQLVGSARDAGLRYLDRIALLRIPIRNGSLTNTADASSAPLATAGQHSQVHDDLFVFTCQAAVDGEETSDG